MKQIISLTGYFAIIFISWLFSSNRRIINWKAITVGTIFQWLFASFIFSFPHGRKIFIGLNNIVVKILECGQSGAKFVFGPLAIPPGEKGSLGFILITQGLPSIVFFSALVGLMYHYGVMQKIIKLFARFFTKTMNISGAESLCTASNIFVGIESTLTIQPYLEKMTLSELCLVLTAGMATVASNVLGLYVSCLYNVFPNIAGHLISASILSAPAAIITSKLILPEEDSPETAGKVVEIKFNRHSSAFEAIIISAQTGMKLIFGIVSLLIAVLGIVALLDLILNITAKYLGFPDLNLKTILGWIFYPFTILLGIDPSEAMIASSIIGERTVATEVAGYMDLAVAISSGMITPRTAVICTYALCGFAHISSLAIFVGGVSVLAPSRSRDLAKTGFKALIAATLACLMTAAVAGIFATDETILLGK